MADSAGSSRRLRSAATQGSLRFALRDRVCCKVGHYEWVLGTIVQQHYREDHGTTWLARFVSTTTSV